MRGTIIAGDKAIIENSTQGPPDLRLVVCSISYHFLAVFDLVP